MNTKRLKRKIEYCSGLILAVVIQLFLVQVSFAAPYGLGDVINTQVSGDDITITINNGSKPGDDILEIKICEDDILKVNYRPSGIASSPVTPIVKETVWDSVGAVINTSSNPMTISTSHMLIEVNKFPCRMTVKKPNGTVLFYEPLSGGVFDKGVIFKRMNGQNMYGLHGYSCFEGDPEILRNNTTRAVKAGQQGDSGGPFVWSTAGYGLLVDSDGGYPVISEIDNKMEFYYGDTIQEGRRYSKNNFEYYILFGEPERIMENYIDITGDYPMLPKWSLGFSNYEWGINQTELYEIVNKYRARDISIDGYGIDYDWKNYGEDNYGEFSWNLNNFPDATGNNLKNNLTEQGIKLIGITKPRIVTKLSSGVATMQGMDAQANNYYYPGHFEYTDYFKPVTVRSIDPYSESCRNWWWEHSISAFDKGVEAWWNDETDKVSAGSANYWFGNYTTNHLSQALYEGQREYTNDTKRVWQTARNYYLGAHRYGTTIWSGDVGTQFKMNEHISWTNGLEEQKAIMLSTINNGQVKWGSDAGGFNQQSGNIENPSPELYTRWLQFAAFTPVFRAHGNLNHQRQPWHYGATAEESVKSVIRMRYELMPYIYSYERTAHEKGIGLVRPLLFDYPTDESVKNYSDAWMFGEHLLVAPITERYQTTKWIYLPPGNWIDYFTGMKHIGNKYIPYSVNGESWTDVPLFLKEGAIIAKQKALPYVNETPVTTLELNVFPSSETSYFRVYDDDGESYDYEDGNYFSQVCSSRKISTNECEFNIEAAQGNYGTNISTYLICIHDAAKSAVTVNGTTLSEYIDLKQLKDASGEGFTVGKDIYGDVVYVKVNAGVAKNIVATGVKNVIAEGIVYEAEEGSCWGNTTSGKAGVNNNHQNYSGDGFVDKFEQDGAAVSFYVDTKSGGYYPLTFRYANGDANDKTMSLYVNGSFHKKLSMQSTGAWDVWTEYVELSKLVAGRNVITLRAEIESGDTGFVNIDNIFVPFVPDVGLYEAEAAALHNGAARSTNHWNYSGSGFVDNIEEVGAKIDFDKIVVPNAGSYPIKIRYANGSGQNRTLNIYVNNQFVTTVNLPSIGNDWNSWGEHSLNLALLQGTNSICFTYDSGNSGHVNLDKIQVIHNSLTVLKENHLDNGSFERPIWDSDAWTEWHPNSQAKAYGVDAGINMNPPETAKEGESRAYFYLPESYQQSIHQIRDVNSGTYKLEFWARNFNTSPNIARAEVKVDNLNPQYYDIIASNHWKHYSIGGFDANAMIDIGFYVNSPGGTTVQIDGVRLIEE